MAVEAMAVEAMAVEAMAVEAMVDGPDGQSVSQRV